MPLMTDPLRVSDLLRKLHDAKQRRYQLKLFWDHRERTTRREQGAFQESLRNVRQEIEDLERKLEG